ncbi:MAG: hypothetical protein ICV60_05365 [Pyrinomonadaceae bacterium]|nr:hypothetical protein [Pyrinomonadaceae bacterium]
MRYSNVKEVGVHPSAKLALLIANSEACFTGDEYVEPVHLLLAALNVVDDNYGDAARRIELSPEEMAAVTEVAVKCRSMLTMSDEEVTSARRGLRKQLSQGGEPIPFRYLNRSGELTLLLQKAARRMHASGEEDLNLAHMLEELLSSIPEEAAPFFADRDSSTQKPLAE